MRVVGEFVWSRLPFDLISLKMVQIHPVKFLWGLLLNIEKFRYSLGWST